MELRKLLTRCCTIIIFGALMLLTPALSSASSYPSASAEQTPQGNFLSGFTLVPGSVTLIEQQYVLALFKNAEDDLYAVVLFNLNCASDDLDRCDVGEVLAYSFFDSQGVEKQLAKGPFGNGVSIWNNPGV